MRLGRLFDRESGRSFVAAIDHGVTIGVPTGAEDALAAVERVVACEPDAVLIAPGLLAKTGDKFAFRGAPTPIVRADWLINDPRLADLGEAYRVLVSPTHAAHLGGEGFIMFLILGVEGGTMFADNVRAVAVAAEEAHKVGMPLMVEVVAWGARTTAQGRRKDADLLALGCRMAAELGADAVKTEWTGDVASMRQVVDGCPAPVLVLGGPKTDSPEPTLEATRGAMEAGAKGVVYGRNVWQADDPLAMSRQLREIIHGQAVLA